MLQKQTRIKFYIMPLTVGAGVVLGGYLLMGGSATFSNTASADSTALVSSASTTVSVDSVISITAPDNVTLDITPNFSSSTFATAAADISVSTNDPYGYSLSMGTSGTDGNGTETTSLIHKTKSSNTIQSITTAITKDDFPTNAWGYTLDNTTYNPLSTSDSSIAIKTTNATAQSDTTTVTFAAKADSTLPSGDYVNTITFSAVANPVVYTMQEMTAKLCASLDEEVTYEFTDTRDGNVYNVARLKDGNCWMQENLALGTTNSAGLTLTSEDSDVEDDWTLPAYDSVGTTWDYNASDAHIIQGSTSASSNWIEGMGNWYTWVAATAGTSSNATTSRAEASGSICPKGWQLPPESSWDITISKSYRNLFAAYGATSNGGTYGYGAVMTSEPILLTLAGEYSFSSGDVTGGDFGNYWTSTASSSTDAYYLRFSASSLGNYNDVYNSYGHSVRCVSQ